MSSILGHLGTKDLVFYGQNIYNGLFFTGEIGMQERKEPEQLAVGPDSELNDRPNDDVIDPSLLLEPKWRGDRTGLESSASTSKWQFGAAAPEQPSAVSPESKLAYCRSFFKPFTPYEDKGELGLDLAASVGLPIVLGVLSILAALAAAVLAFVFLFFLLAASSSTVIMDEDVMDFTLKGLGISFVFGAIAAVLTPVFAIAAVISIPAMALYLVSRTLVTAGEAIGNFLKSEPSEKDMAERYMGDAGEVPTFGS